jgi:hypothetical protein
MLVGNVRGWPKQMLILPVTDPRHEFNSEQIGQAENGCALALCVGMNRVRLNLGLVFLQEVQDIGVVAAIVQKFTLAYCMQC